MGRTPKTNRWLVPLQRRWRWAYPLNCRRRDTSWTSRNRGSNVVATGSGAIDLTDTTSVGIGLPQAAFLDPAISAIITGLTGSSDAYGAFITGPSNFGGWYSTNANSGSGGLVGIILTTIFTCHRVTSPTVPCRTPRPTTTRPSAASV